MTYGTLYLCATPIGNLDDITVRCLNTLKECDMIACEDTRHSLKLLNHFDIHKPLTSYYEHNKKEKGEYIIGQLKEGKNVALVSDAGTPAISDPGEDLVRDCIKEGIKVVPIPGAVALINALIISGQNTSRFAFEGFLSVNKKSRFAHLEEVAKDSRTLIFYEAPHKLKKTLSDMRKYFGNRSLTLVRELTKIHEEVFLTDFDTAISHYEENLPKGEFVLIVEGYKDDKLQQNTENLISVTERVNALISEGIDKKEAIKKVAVEIGLSKRDVYNEYVRGEE